jgi:23S rRNA (adenine2503-C2)-methyltransferase
MRGLLDLSKDELLAWLQARGEPSMRARQLRRWILVARAETFEQMTDLPRELRQVLASHF